MEDDLNGRWPQMEDNLNIFLCLVYNITKNFVFERMIDEIVVLS